MATSNEELLDETISDSSVSDACDDDDLPFNVADEMTKLIGPVIKRLDRYILLRNKQKFTITNLGHLLYRENQRETFEKFVRNKLGNESSVKMHVLEFEKDIRIFACDKMGTDNTLQYFCVKGRYLVHNDFRKRVRDTIVNSNVSNIKAFRMIIL